MLIMIYPNQSPRTCSIQYLLLFLFGAIFFHHFHLVWKSMRLYVLNYQFVEKWLGFVKLVFFTPIVHKISILTSTHILVILTRHHHQQLKTPSQFSVCHDYGKMTCGSGLW